jgi:YVTN family beta-propeller protein
MPDMVAQLCLISAHGSTCLGYAGDGQLRTIWMSVLSTGSILGDFRIEGEIGRGGMGVVYRAVQVSLGRAAAVKVIGEGLAHDPEFRERFVRESRLAASIDHPNVIPVYAAGEDDGVLYLAMRCLEGTDLRALLRTGGPLEPRRAAAVVAQVASALDAAHERGLVHRDVKPANVLIAGRRPAEHVYLTDFGLTKLSSSDSRLTASGQFIGTVDYVAPEQLRGDQVDGRADVYALGCVLYETLTGQVPFPREDDLAKLWAHMSDPAPSALDVAPEAPAALAALAQRAMEKDPAQRYATAGDMGRAALAAVGLAAPDDSDATRPAGAFPPGRTAATAALESPARPWARRRGVRWALGVLAVGAVVAIAAALLVDGDDAGQSPEPKGRQGPVGEVVGDPVRIGGAPVALGAGSTFVWVLDELRGSVMTVSQQRNLQVRRDIRVGGHPRFLALTSGAVWVAATDEDSLLRIDARRRTVTDRIPVGKSPVGIGLAPGEAWVVNHDDGTVVLVDTASRAVVGAPVKVGRAPVNAVVAAGSVWVTNSADDTVTRIDTADHRVLETIPVGDHPEGLSTSGESVWVANRDDDTVSRIDVATNRVAATIAVGDRPLHLKVGQNGVWVPNSGDGTVTYIDRATDRVVGRPVRLARGVARVGVGFDAVWAANPLDGTLTRIDPDVN